MRVRSISPRDLAKTPLFYQGLSDEGSVFRFSALLLQFMNVLHAQRAQYGNDRHADQQRPQTELEAAAGRGLVGHAAILAERE
jgi:hypothetical protein